MNHSERSPASVGRGERKQVTAVFIDVVGFSDIASTADAEDLEQWLEEFYAQARSIVEEHDGEVTEYLGDGVVALFGLEHADELTASKAVNAALAAVANIDAVYKNGGDIQLRAGVATGEVAVRRRNASNLPRATGMVTTLAQRIQERAAPSGVMIAQSTKDLLRGTIVAKAIPGQKLKGFAEIQTLYQPTATIARPDNQLQPFFVGRTNELSRIENSNQPSLVIGPAGIGKTALCRYVAQSASRIATFNANGVHTRASYQPFKDWIAIHTRTSLPEFSDIQRCFEPFGLSTDAQRALALVLGLTDGQRLLAEKSNVALKALIEDAIWQAIQAIQPDGILVFEDLHWLDNASFGVLVNILQSPEAGHYQILMTSREDTKIGKYLDNLPISLIPLDALDRVDASNMLDALAAGKTQAKNREALIEKAAGVPLFLEQLFQRSLSDNDQGIPGSLMDLLASQIDATGTSKPVLQCASVIGRNFNIEMLRAIAKDYEPLQPHLAKACARGVLTEQSNDSWTFSHALLHQAAYHGLLRRTRVDFHSQIASHLQENHADAVRRNPAILTDHLSLAQQHVPAIQNYLTVSQWALFQGAFEDAETHILAAISLCSQAPTDVDVHDLKIACYTALASIRVQLGGYMTLAVKEAFEAVSDLASTQQGYSAANGPAFCGMFSHAIISGDRTGADQFCKLLLETAAHVPVSETNGEVQLAALNVEACLHCYSGNFEKLFVEFAKLRDLYDIDKHGAMITQYGVDPFAATQMFDSVGRSICGETHSIRDLVAESDAHQDLLNIPVMLPYSLIWGSVPLFYAGDVTRAVARVKQGIEAAHEQGAAFWQVTGAAWLNVMDPSQSSTKDGLVAFGQVLNIHEMSGARVGLPYFRSHYAMALARQGEIDTALQESMSAVIENEASGLNCWLAEVLRLHAQVCIMAGQTEAATAAFAKSADIATSQNARLWLIRTRLDQFKAGLITKTELAHAVEMFHENATPPEIITAKEILADI
ncbi:AAA ATPase-like protein [Yoonia maritima]|uniref:AAA ATPase-like protein n=1 Tax=Yoonia maritima TaxID=1435347 RepID=A0A2T0VW38_9RHOB|nr:adenylate/guanylate cyclase domain-containing protein [Yoonia maritima]PRY76017.1 AAA ATPase-like protein [Yoonia maritima]